MRDYIRGYSHEGLAYMFIESVPKGYCGLPIVTYLGG